MSFFPKDHASDPCIHQVPDASFPSHDAPGTCQPLIARKKPYLLSHCHVRAILTATVFTAAITMAAPAQAVPRHYNDNITIALAVAAGSSGQYSSSSSADSSALPDCESLAGAASHDRMLQLIDYGYAADYHYPALRIGPEVSSIPFSLLRRAQSPVIFEHHTYQTPELFSYIHQHRSSSIITENGILPVFRCLDPVDFWSNPLHHVHSDSQTFYFYPDACSVAAYMAGDVAAAARSGSQTQVSWESSGDRFALSTMQTEPGSSDTAAGIPIATVSSAIASVKEAGAELLSGRRKHKAAEEEPHSAQEIIGNYPARHKPRFVDGKPYMEDANGDGIIDIPDDSHYIYLYTSFVMHNLLEISCQLENKGCDQLVAYARDMNRNFNPAWESQENEIWARSSSFYYDSNIPEEKEISRVQSVRTPGVSAMAASHAASAHSMSIRRQAESIRQMQTPYGADSSVDYRPAAPGILLEDQDIDGTSSRGIYIGVLNARSFERYERFDSYVRRDLVPFSFGQQYIGRVSGREYETAWREYIDKVNSGQPERGYGSGCYLSASGYYMSVFGNNCIPYGGFERLEARANERGTLSSVTLHSRLSPEVDSEDFINFLSVRYDRIDPSETAAADIAVLYEEICSAMKELSEDRYNCKIYWFRDHNNYLKVTYGAHDNNRTLSLLFTDENFLFTTERNTLNRRLASIRNEIKVKNHIAINGPSRSSVPDSDGLTARDGHNGSDGLSGSYGGASVQGTTGASPLAPAGASGTYWEAADNSFSGSNKSYGYGQERARSQSRNSYPSMLAPSEADDFADYGHDNNDSRLYVDHVRHGEQGRAGPAAAQDSMNSPQQLNTESMPEANAEATDRPATQAGPAAPSDSTATSDPTATSDQGNQARLATQSESGSMVEMGDLARPDDLAGPAAPEDYAASDSAAAHPAAAGYEDMQSGSSAEAVHVPQEDGQHLIRPSWD